jgi:hypothetical protein
MSAVTDLVARLPWVTRLNQSRDCDGYRWSRMSFKARRNPELMARYKCKASARWQFRADRRAQVRADDGTYCWRHLWSLGLQFSPAEQARTNRGLAKLVSAAEWNAMLAASPGKAAGS